MQLSGYLIFLSLDNSSYRGVDRERFEPAFEPNINDPGDNLKFIYQFQPVGWKKEAMRIYEEGRVEIDSLDSIDLIAQLKTAKSILSIIEPHLGPCEILSVNITSQPIPKPPDEGAFLGIDVAYLGGDFYSAIKQGVLDPNSVLRERYLSALNPNGLFENYKLATEYLADFRIAALSEANSQFHYYSLSKVH